MEGAGLQLGFGPESSTGRLSTPTAEIRFRSLRDRLAPPCSTQQLSFQWFCHANRPFIPCPIKFFQLFLDSSRNHVVICYWILNLHARHMFRPPRALRLNSIRGTAFRVPSLLSVPQASCASFVFMHLRIANFTTPFFSQPYKMPGVCTPLALSSACSFPRACVTFLLFDTLLLRRYYQFFSYGTPSALAVPAADSHETRLF